MNEALSSSNCGCGCILHDAACSGATGLHAQEADDASSPEVRSKPPITQVEGTWTGHTSVNDGGSGNCDACPMTLDLSQAEKKIGGSFDITTGDENPTGSVSGNVAKDKLTLTLRTSGGSKQNCKATLNAQVSGDSMVGSWSVKKSRQCKGMGAFNLQKQPS